MARRIVIKTKTNDKMEFKKPLLAEDTYELSYMKTPLYGPPELIIEGDFEFEIEELRDYVQVEFVGTEIAGPRYFKAGNWYTYVDPGLDLKIGDLVDVPTKYREHNLAIVRALGADNGDLADFIVKEVAARYAKVEIEKQSIFTDPESSCFCGDPECYG